MGAALLWVMQIHMSWPLLGPYIAYAAFACRRDGAARLARLRARVHRAAPLIPGAALVPTLAVLRRRSPDRAACCATSTCTAVNPFIIVTTMARFFSFASLEIVRFIATDNAKRLEFFLRHRFLIPLAIVVWAVGIAQPVWMLIEWFRHRRARRRGMEPPALARRRVGADRLRQLLVRDGAAAGARVLRAGADRVAVRGVVLDVRRRPARADVRRRRARHQHRVPRRAGVGAGAGQIALQEPRAGGGGRDVQGAGDAGAPPRRSPWTAARRRSQDPTRPYDPTRDIEVTQSVAARSGSRDR